MYALALYGIVVEQFVLLVEALLVRQVGLGFQFREFRRDVGQHEQGFVVDLLGQPFCTFVGQVARIELLVNHEIQRFNSFGHAPVVVLHIDFLGLEHACLDAFFREELDERLVFGQSLVRTVERKEALVGQLLVVLLLALGYLLLCVGQILCGEFALHVNQLLHERLVFLKHLVVALGYRTGDDERRTRVVDKYGVHLVDYGVVVCSLHEVGW